MPAELAHPLPDSGGSFGEEPISPLVDPQIEGPDVHAVRCAPGVSHVGVVVAPLAGLQLIQRPFRLLYPAGLPMQQPNGLGADQHQPGGTTTVHYIDEGADLSDSVSAAESTSKPSGGADARLLS